MHLDNAAEGGEHGHTAVLELGLAQPVSLSKQPTACHTQTRLLPGQPERLLPLLDGFLAPFRGPRAYAQSRMAWGTILARHALALQLDAVLDCGECPTRAGGRVQAGSRRWSGDRSPCRQPRCLLHACMPISQSAKATCARAARWEPRDCRQLGRSGPGSGAKA